MEASRNWIRRALLFVIVLTLFITACNYPGIRSIQVSDADRIATVKQDTPCFNGPGPSYKVVTLLKAGMEVVLIGVSQRADYLVMQQPDNPAEHCWGALVDIITTEDLIAEFMKLNVENPADGPTPTNPEFYVEFKLALVNAATRSGPTSTFHPRDVPHPSTSTPYYATVSMDFRDLITPTFTPDPLFDLIVYVNRDALCWSGPGSAYDVVQALLAGQDVKLIGEDSQQEWYILESPIYPGVNCWTEQGAVTAPPDALVLPIIPVPPLPTRTPESGAGGGSPACFASLPTKEKCEAAGGTWLLAVPPPNQCNCP
jgi:hypothetical protein